VPLPGRFSACAGTAFLLTLVGGSPVAAQERPPTLEYQVKAAYLLNFPHYVEWPVESFAAAQSPVNVCIVGHDPFGAAIDDAARGRIARGRLLIVRRVSGPDGTRSCHIVFVSREERGRNPRILEQLSRPGLLTVGEGTQFAEDGGVIGLVISNENVRFVVNLEARDHAALRISSRMLSLAVGLVGREPVLP